MKKLLLSLICVMGLLGACQEPKTTQTNNELLPNTIYFFYSTSCPHCHDAMAYLNKHHPNLKLSMENVSTQQGYELLFKCAEKFNLGNRIGTPLFCMDDKYIMGWSDQNAAQFEEYVKPYLNK